MAEHLDLIIRGGTCLTPAGRLDTDIGVSGGRITAIGDLAAASADTVLDAKGLHVLPGVIDSQVHFREPGNEHKEDLESGTRAAIMGGVTAVFEMPNTNPPTVSTADLTDKIKRAGGRAWCDFAFFIGAAKENVNRLAGLEQLTGCCGIKVFMGSSTGSLLVAEKHVLREVMSRGRRRIAIHAEDEERLKARYEYALDGGKPYCHPIWRDEETALLATRRALELAGETRRRIHILHVTTAAEMGLLAQHKDLATVEVTPQHLTLAAPEAYNRLGTLAQMNPPIRDEKQRIGLWKAVASGVVDVIGSDHAPHTLEEKEKPYPESPSGMPGVQTLVPVMLNHVHEGRLTLERFVDLTAAGPARIYNVARKGRIAVGFDADFTIVDLKAKRTITADWIVSKCGWTPFDGMAVTGWPAATVIRGRIVMREDETQGDPIGRTVPFIDTGAR
ncbi:MAG: dihydroorotase [Rhodospirillales bacterium]|nr:MAG: dihydroorotase [Rhodospirillales bacterium]